MEMRFIDEATVARLLTPAVLRPLMRETLIALATGDARGPTRSVVAVTNGWFGSMPASVGRRGLGSKLVSFFPGNVERNLPTHAAVVLLADPQTGRFIAAVAGETITERRTAAVSVVATERLAARPRGTLAILGSGVQGRSHLDAFRDAGLADRVVVWSPRGERAQRLATYAQSKGCDATLAESPSAAVANADVIVTATSSSTPLFAAGDVADGAHINAVGACVPSRRELPAELVAEANLYVDSIDAAWIEAGDLILAAQDLGHERIQIRAELGAMLVDSERRDPPRRVTLFKSLGLGIEDVACAAYVLEQSECN